MHRVSLTIAWMAGILCLPAPNTAAEIQEVVIAFKTHYDIGYTDLASAVIERYRTGMIDQALEVCDQNRALPPEQQFVWTIPGWPMAQILGEGQSPERRVRVMEALKRGWFVTHALPFTTHTETLELEDLVRGLGFSSAIAREAGLDLPRDAKMTDVPSHSWVMPTLLKHAGVDFLHIGCNSASASPDLPPLFWWEGPDGSRLLTAYSATYGSGLAPPEDWPYPVWLALIHTGDNHGPPRPEEVKKLLDQAAKELPGVKVRLGRLSDFADDLLAFKPEIPVVRGDLPDTWIHGIMSMPIESKAARDFRPLLPALESLDTLLPIWGAPDAPPPPIAAAYEHSLRFGEHTWGLDFKPFPHVFGAAWQEARAAGKYAKPEATWREKGAHAEAVRDIATQGLGEGMTRLARAVNTEGPRIVVFNPLPWARDGVVEIAAAGAAPRALIDIESQAALPVQIQDGRLSFLARDVPAMGYRSYAFAETALPSPNAA